MRAKLILGVGIPLFIIISFIILGVSDTGYEETATTIESISRASMDNNEQLLIRTITLKNDYFLPKVVDSPAIRGCLIDSSGKIGPSDVRFTILEHEGDSTVPTRTLSNYGLFSQRSYLR